MAITIDGKKYAVTENIGFSHDLGCYVKAVLTPDGERIAVKVGIKWEFKNGGVIAAVCLPPLMTP